MTYDEQWEINRMSSPEIPGWRQPDDVSKRRSSGVDSGVAESMEPYQQLEQEIARWAGYEPEQVVVCSTGSAALHLACEALQLPRGSEVIVPDFTFIACARAVTLAGLTPVFVDCGEDLLLDSRLVEQAACDGSKVEVVMPVHVYGRQCKPYNDEWWYTLTKHVYIIEDLAEAHGVKPHPLTDAACWSFYKNKIVAGEEGGAVAFRDVKHAARARALRSQGYCPGGNAWVHLPGAMNYRMTNAQAELIRKSLLGVCGDQLGFHSNVYERRRIEAWYEAACPSEWMMPSRDVPWVYDLRIKGMKYAVQDRVVKALRGAGIEARHGFKPLSKQREYISAGCHHQDWSKPPESLSASQEVVCLPIQPGVTTEYFCRRAFEIIRSAIGGA